MVKNIEEEIKYPEEPSDDDLLDIDHELEDEFGEEVELEDDAEETEENEEY